MIRNSIEGGDTFTGVSRSIPEFLQIDMQLNPNYLEQVWTEITHDKRFLELGHAALDFASKQYPGNDTSAIAAYNGFLNGVRFATEVLRKSIDSVRSDKEMIENLDKAS